jgi:hypothetical protein
MIAGGKGIYRAESCLGCKESDFGRLQTQYLPPAAWPSNAADGLKSQPHDDMPSHRFPDACPTFLTRRNSQLSIRAE